jgi:hypothetical protein
MKLPSSLLTESVVDERWSKGPFMNLKTMSAKTKGKRFEQIADFIFCEMGMEVRKAESSDYDRIVENHRVEIKGSTITKGSDDWFSFLQIRPNQDYDFLVLETFWFDGTVKFYRLNKKTVIDLIGAKIFKKQHGGSKAESGTFCYNGTMQPFEKWFWFEVKVD